MRHRADRPLHFCVFWLRVGYWRLGNALCWFAFQCAALFRATVLAHEKWPIRASLRPLDIYIYVFGSQSCATRLIFVGSARLWPETKPRMAPLVEFGAVLGVSASLPLPAPPLPSSSRRYAPQYFVGGIPPSRLATCLTAHPTNRVVACRSVRHSPPRPLPHLPIGAFLFVAFALADVPSARLILSAANVSRFNLAAVLPR